MPAYCYFREGDLTPQTRVMLTGAEGHHATRVMRRSRGDEITLINGRGQSASARVLEHGRDTLLCEIINAVSHSHRYYVALVQGIVRWEALCWIVEKATELGVAHIGLALRDKDRTLSDAKQEHLRKIAIAALKQSGNYHLPIIGPIKPLEQWQFPLDTELYFADPCANHQIIVKGQLEQKRVLFVGPESGFTEKERHYLCNSGAKGICLSSSILRSETAAICGLHDLCKR